jgi:ArsR family transcriptional regulator
VLDRAAVETSGALFKALSAPVRIAVVVTLDTEGPLCVHELVERLNVSQSLVSQHLRVLRSADVVRGTRRGKEIAYEIADTHVAHIVRDALAHTQEDHP